MKLKILGESENSRLKSARTSFTLCLLQLTNKLSTKSIKRKENKISFTCEEYIKILNLCEEYFIRTNNVISLQYGQSTTYFHSQRIYSLSHYIHLIKLTGAHRSIVFIFNFCHENQKVLLWTHWIICKIQLIAFTLLLTTVHYGKKPFFKKKKKNYTMVYIQGGYRAGAELVISLGDWDLVSQRYGLQQPK